MTAKRKLGILAAVIISSALLQTDGATGSIYDQPITPLTVEECGRCHISHFNRLKDRGDKHRQVACTECHELFHAYNPLKGNYADIMPKCSSCHEAPHGQAEAVQVCLNCHTDPHQPLAAIPASDLLEGQCRACHSAVGQSLVQSPSKHTEVKCSSCHSEKHGRIPQCADCHESHSPAVQMDTPACLACHPVHTPLQISYPVTQNNKVCAGCHEGPVNLLQARETKHSALTCAKCHPGHAQLMACQECHGEPHGKAIHNKYAACGMCHNIAHDLQK